MKRVWNKLFVNFFNGIVILMPVVITIALVKFLVFQVNNMILNPIVSFLNTITKGPEHVYLAKSIIFVFVIFLVSLIGLGAKIIVFNRFFSFGENLLIRLPILGKIYNAIKQISSAFLGEGKTIFKKVVLVEYPREGLYSIGFTTGESKGEIDKALDLNGVNVFIPTTPNPTSGIFIIAPKEQVQFLNMSIEEGLKLVISGGSVTPLFKSE